MMQHAHDYKQGSFCNGRLEKLLVSAFNKNYDMLLVGLYPLAMLTNIIPTNETTTAFLMIGVGSYEISKLICIAYEHKTGG